MRNMNKVKAKQSRSETDFLKIILPTFASVQIQLLREIVMNTQLQKVSVTVLIDFS